MLSIIIYGYNKAATIHRILDKIKEVQLLNGITKEFRKVNNCSSDDTKGKISFAYYFNSLIYLRLKNIRSVFRSISK
jgi:hypothetical protein